MKHLAILLLIFGFVSSVLGQTLPDNPVPIPDPARNRLAQNPIPDAKAPNGQIALPTGTPVMLVSLDSIFPSVAKTGSAVRFAVANDVAIGGTVIIRAGEPVTGVVTKAKGGRSEGRKGRLEIRINPIRFGSDVKLRLMDSDPKFNRGPLGELRVRVVFVGQCIIYLPLCLAIEAMAHQDSKDGQDYGLDFLPDCDKLQFWTVSTVSIPENRIPPPPPNGTAEIRDSCPTLDLSSKPGFDAPYLRHVKFR